MVREFVDRVFDGSARPLLVHLLKEKGLTERETRELQKLLDKEERMTVYLWNLAAYAIQLAALVVSVALAAALAAALARCRARRCGSGRR